MPQIIRYHVVFEQNVAKGMRGRKIKISHADHEVVVAQHLLQKVLHVFLCSVGPEVADPYPVALRHGGFKGGLTSSKLERQEATENKSITMTSPSAPTA